MRAQRGTDRPAIPTSATMPGLRVAVDGRCLNTTHLRGMGKYASNLIKAILSADASVEFHVLADEPSAPLHAPKDRRITSRVWEQKGHRLHAWEQAALPLEARRASAILHCLGTWCPLWQPLPVVVTVHDTLPWEEDPMRTLSRRRGSRRVQARHRADHNQSKLSERYREQMASAGGEDHCHTPTVSNSVTSNQPGTSENSCARMESGALTSSTWGETSHESAWIGPYGSGKVCETLICSLSSAAFRKGVARPGQPD